MGRGCQVLLAVALAGIVQAHRLDECLQATRLAVAPDGVEFSIEITPGVEIADSFLEVLDRNRDQVITPEEGEAYACGVVRDLAVGLDGVTVDLKLQEVTLPRLEEIKAGRGMIRVRAGAAWAGLTEGVHSLSLTNRHLPHLSVYHVNALKVGSGKIQLIGQHRDLKQKGYVLEFRVREPGG